MYCWCQVFTLRKIQQKTNIVRKIIAIMLKSPIPDQLKNTRKALGYTQREAAELVHVSLRAWQLWEAGDRKMPPGIWELCVIKAGLHPLYRAHKA
jgi:putative transcriptional regulator